MPVAQGDPHQGGLQGVFGIVVMPRERGRVAESIAAQSHHSTPPNAGTPSSCQLFRAKPTLAGKSAFLAGFHKSLDVRQGPNRSIIFTASEKS